MRISDWSSDVCSSDLQDTWIDYVVRIFSIGGIAIPSFWLGIMILLGLLIVTQAWFGAPWLPPIQYVPIWVDPWQNLAMLIWPALATGYRYSAVDRKSVVEGKSESVGVDLGGRRIIKNKKK